MLLKFLSNLNVSEVTAQNIFFLLYTKKNFILKCPYIVIEIKIHKILVCVCVCVNK